MDRSLIFFVLAFVGFAQFAEGDRVRCLECNRLTKPQDCTKDVICDETEICVTEQYVTDLGHTLFDVGCRLKSSCAATGYKSRHGPVQSDKVLIGRKRQNVAAHLCIDCCETDMCNKHLCGGTENGKLECVHCSGLMNMTYCTELEICESNEVCYIEKKITDTFGQQYAAGCVKRTQCDAHHVAKRQIDNVVDLCFNCCNTSMCNIECHRDATPAVTTTLTTATSTKTTTTTPTTTAPTTTTPTTSKSTPTPTPTSTSTPTPTPTSTSTHTPTPTSTSTHTPTPTSTSTHTSTANTSPMPSTICPTFPPLATKQPPKILNNVLVSLGCSGKNDVVLLVDNSDSVKDEDAHHFEMFARVLSATLDIGPDKTRMGYTYFGQNISDQVHLGNGGNQKILYSRLAQAEARYGTSGGKASLGEGLRHIDRVVFSPKHERQGAKKYLVILTKDDLHDMQAAMSEATALKNRGVEIVFIGIGDFKGSTGDLEKIVTSPQKTHMIIDDSVDDLQYSLEDMFVSRCRGNTPTVAPDPCGGPKLLNYLGCGAKEDIVLILDHSGSISDSDWKKMVEFTHKLVDNFNVSHDASDIGVMTFNKKLTDIVHLHAFNDKASLLNAIDTKLNKISVSGGTWTHLALNETLHWFHVHQRHDAVKVAIIFTDGGSERKFETFSTALDLHHNNVTVFVVGIGGDIDLYEQMILASDPDAEHMLNVGDYHNLITYLDYLLAVRCRDMAMSSTTVSPSTTIKRH